MDTVNIKKTWLVLAYININLIFLKKEKMKGMSIFDIFYSKKIGEIYVVYTSWRILKKKEGMYN